MNISAMAVPFISIIIPAYNEEELLPRLLQAVADQSYKDFEVILVDAYSTDKTVYQAKKFSKIFPLTIIMTHEHNVSISRNLGAEKAKGEYLFFIDADNYIRQQFLEKMIEKLKKNYELIVTAIAPDSRNYFYKASYHLANSIVQATWKLHFAFSTGGNFLIRKSLFNSLHGFDKSIFVGEDHDLVGRARKAGARVIFVTKPKVIFSTRRLEKEGWAMVLKYFFSTIYILFFGKMTKKMYNYEMGGEYYKKVKEL